jgi:hypothetical protein
MRIFLSSTGAVLTANAYVKKSDAPDLLFNVMAIEIAPVDREFFVFNRCGFNRHHQNKSKLSFRCLLSNVLAVKTAPVSIPDCRILSPVYCILCAICYVQCAFIRYNLFPL